MKIRIVNKSSHAHPHYATGQSAGMDLRANIEGEIRMAPLERKMLSTGLFIELPPGCEGQVRPRSGLAKLEGLTVLNAPGTIDADYRGEIMVLLVNLSDEEATIRDGQRIAQLVVARHEKVEWVESQDLTPTDRGGGGYGHTGDH